MTMHHAHSELPNQTKSLLDMEHPKKRSVEFADQTKSLLDMENHKKKRENSINGVNNHTVLDMFENHGDDSRQHSFQVDHSEKVTKKFNFFSSKNSLP